MKKEPISQYLKRRLAELRGKLTIVSNETGLGYNTVYRMSRGEGDPLLSNVETVIAWLDKYDAIRAHKPDPAKNIGRPRAKKPQTQAADEFAEA